MTQFKTFTDAERAALILHGLDYQRPSQLSDAFVLGLRHQAGHAKLSSLLDLALEYGVAMRLVGMQEVRLERGEEIRRVVDASPAWDKLASAIQRPLFYAFKHNLGKGLFRWTFHTPEEYPTAYRDTCLEIIPLVRQ